MAVVVDSLPKLELSSVFSFGLGHAKLKKGFGLDEGTCGLVQETRVYQGSNRGALVNFGRHFLGRRVDCAGTKLAPPIKQGSRLGIHLSARGADAPGRRTARFFVDGSEAATFVLQDDGRNTGWVAGVTLSDRARVRLVPAEGAELAQRARAINEVMIF